MVLEILLFIGVIWFFYQIGLIFVFWLKICEEEGMSFKLIIVLLIVNYVYVLSSEGNYLFEGGGGD